jgi:hypothetical protein
MQQITEGVWAESDPVRIVGMPLSSNMTVLDLGREGLLVHSPVPLTAERRAAVDAIGEVAHLYAPNTYHHMSIGDWARAYPRARVHAPRGLATKRPDLRIDRMHDEMPEAAFADALDEIHVDGFAMEETVLVHRASGSLVVADLVHNIGRPRDAWAALYTRLAGFYDRVAVSRVIALLAFSDRRAARRSLDAILAHDFRRIVVGHGAPVEPTANEALARAYAWLPARDALVRVPRFRDTAPCG